jgi:hypothetical protein
VELSTSNENITLDLTLRGSPPYQSTLTNLSLNALIKNFRYVAFRGVTYTTAYNGFTSHEFPLNEDPFSFKAGLNRLMNEYRIPANKLILEIHLFYFVHILNETEQTSDAHLLGEPSTLLSNRQDLPGSAFISYSDVIGVHFKIMVCPLLISSCNVPTP